MQSMFADEPSVNIIIVHLCFCLLEPIVLFPADQALPVGVRSGPKWQLNKHERLKGNDL